MRSITNHLVATLRSFLRAISVVPNAAIRAWSHAPRRRLVLAAAVAAVLLLVGVGGVVVYQARATGEGQVFEGTKAPGAHEWWKLNRATAQADFCGRCHARIVSDFAHTVAAGSHPFTTCVDCHSPTPRGGHVAAPAKCVDCHATQAQQLANDAHSSFYTDLHEDATTASWSCKACHTKVQVDMRVTPVAPLPITLDP